jgi:hypothetical protein
MKVERNWFKELRQETENKGFWTRGTKVNVGIALMVVTILLSAGILQATRTFTDSNDTHTGTVVYNGNFDFTSGSYFNLSKKITNSKGGVWNATGANIQIAINDLANLTGTVYVPAGTFYTSGDIRIGSNCHLKGAGMYSTIIKCGVTTHIRCLGAYGKQNVMISDFTYHGNNSISGGSQKLSNSIEFRGCRNVSIINIRSIYSASNALVFDDSTESEHGFTSVGYGVKGFVIDNYEAFATNISGSKHGISMSQSENGIVNNIRVNDSYGDGIDESGCYNVTYSNLNLRKIAVDGMKITSASGKITRYIVVNGAQINATGHGIKLEGVDANSVQYVSISNVHINCNGNGIFILDQANHVVITDFFIQASLSGTGGSSQAIATERGGNNYTISDGEALEGTNTVLYFIGNKDVTVSNVKVRNGFYQGILLHDMNKTSITGCTVEHSATWGIDCDGCRNLTISECDIAYNTVSSYGGIDFKNCSGFIFENNRVTGNHESVKLYNTYCNNFIILGNYISGNTHAFSNCTGATLAVVKHNLNNGAYLDS